MIKVNEMMNEKKKQNVTQQTYCSINAENKLKNNRAAIVAMTFDYIHQ